MSGDEPTIHTGVTPGDQPDGNPGGVPADLTTALRSIAGLSVLLVASDYDGVLAPIVTDPAKAVPLPGAVPALRRLAGLPGTTVAAVSGRARDDLATVSGLPGGEITLIGSHGSELASEVRLEPEQADLRARLEQAVRELADEHPGVRVELKPGGVVLHTRTAERPVAARVTDAVLAGPAAWPGVHVTTGKEVVELSVLTANKGTAITYLRERTGAEAVVFLGDDVTDENAFAVLDGADVGIKVGSGQTRAQHRVADPPAALAALQLLLREREHRLR